MAGVAGNIFKGYMLAAGLGKTAQALDAYILLFTNAYDPLEDDVLGDYTEATFSGYAQIVLPKTDWTVTPGAPAIAVQPEVIFASDADQAPEDIEGYAIFLSDDTFVCGERFTSPQTVESDGDEIRVTPRVRNYTKA